MEFIVNPYDIKKIQELSRELYELNLISFEDFQFAQNLQEPIFLNNSPDNFEHQFYWDMNYFLYKNHYSIYNLVFEIGSFYFSKTTNKDNIELVATIAQKIFQSQKTFENSVSKMREIQYKNNFANIKFFSNSNNEDKSAKVQIMTLHKSKGDEFDYVFIPELTQNNLCFSEAEYVLKENSKFIQKVKKYPKNDIELKKEIIEENARLIYVGITRAKKKLYLSVAQKYKIFNREKEQKPSEFLENIL